MKSCAVLLWVDAASEFVAGFEITEPVLVSADNGQVTNVSMHICREYCMHFNFLQAGV